LNHSQEEDMWVTFFALATAASVWLSAASLAVQYTKQRALFNIAIEKQAETPTLGPRQLTSANNGAGDQTMID
jgi:hypothetical protein